MDQFGAESKAYRSPCHLSREWWACCDYLVSWQYKFLIKENCIFNFLCSHTVHISCELNQFILKMFVCLLLSMYVFHVHPSLLYSKLFKCLDSLWWYNFLNSSRYLSAYWLFNGLIYGYVYPYKIKLFACR